MQNELTMEIRDTRNGDWHWVNNAVIACKHITHAEKSVYNSLATFSGCKEIYPSFAIIAERANVSIRLAKKAIKRLAFVGYVTLKKGGGRGHSNLYNLLKVPKGCRLCTVSKGCTNQPERVHKTTINGAQSAPKVDKEVDKKYINGSFKKNDDEPTSIRAVLAETRTRLQKQGIIH